MQVVRTLERLTVKTVKKDGGMTWEPKAVSKWSVNGKEGVPEPQIKALMARYSIQMDNACMFLPQEKIGAFTELNSEDVRDGDAAARAGQLGS